MIFSSFDILKVCKPVIKKLYVSYTLQNSRSTQRTMFAPPKLTVSSVFTKLKEIATMTGHAVSMIDLHSILDRRTYMYCKLGNVGENLVFSSPEPKAHKVSL